MLSIENINLLQSLSSLRELTAKWKDEKGIKAILWEGEGTTDLKGLLRGSSLAEKFI